MSIVSAMSAKKASRKTADGLSRVNVRTSTEITLVLDRVRANVACTPLYAHEGITQEIFIAATWLWLDTLRAEDLARDLHPFVAKAEAAFSQQKPTGNPDIDIPVDEPSSGEVKVPRRKARG